MKSLITRINESKSTVNEAFIDTTFSTWFAKADAKMKDKFKASFLEKRENAIQNTKLLRILEYGKDGYIYQGTGVHRYVSEYQKTVDDVIGSRNSAAFTKYDKVLVCANSDGAMVGFIIYDDKDKFKIDTTLKGIKTDTQLVQWVLTNGGAVASTNLKSSADAFVTSSDGPIHLPAVQKDKLVFQKPEKIQVNATLVHAISSKSGTVAQLHTALTAQAKNNQIDLTGAEKTLGAEVAMIMPKLIAEIKDKKFSLSSSKFYENGNTPNIVLVPTKGGGLVLQLHFKYRNDQYDRSEGFRLNGSIALDVLNPKNDIRSVLSSERSELWRQPWFSTDGSVWGSYDISEHENGYQNKKRFASQIKQVLKAIGGLPSINKLQKAWLDFQTRSTETEPNSIESIGFEKANELYNQIIDKVEAAVNIQGGIKWLSLQANGNKWEKAIMKLRNRTEFKNLAVLSLGTTYKIAGYGGRQGCPRNGWSGKAVDAVLDETTRLMNEKIFGGKNILINSRAGYGTLVLNPDALLSDII